MGAVGRAARPARTPPAARPRRGAATGVGPRPASARPAFLDELSRAHHARLARCIILSGNINDLFPHPDGDAVRFVALDALLRHAFWHARYPTTGAEVRFIVASLRSDGIAFASERDRATLAGLADALRAEQPDLAADLATILKEAATERASSLVTLTLVAELLRLVSRVRARGVPVRPLVVVVDQAESLLPAGDAPHLAPLDREAVKVFSDLLRDDGIWAEAETADVYPDVIVLLTATAAELNRKIAPLPKTVHVTVPLPDEATRAAFVRSRLAGLGAPFVELAPGYALERFVADARGLTVRALDDLLTAARRDPSAFSIDRAAIVGAVNTILQERLGPIIKLVDPDHGMEEVVGFRRLKARLAALRRRFDDPDRAPAGITVVGPNGSGKTFMLEAFARDTDRTVITLSQIRSEWYGKTDVFAEMFEAGVAAFGRILILVDEAHVAFGSIHSRDTHETEARLTRHMIQMIDDLSYRSRIVWALITTRPDLLDPDFVRAGRCSLFVPVFDPEGDDAREFAAFVVRRLAKAGIRLTAAERGLLTARTAGFSAGDYREFADDFADERAFDRSVTLARFLDGWTPSSVSLARERESQILLAALHCDWPELLPERLRDVPKDRLREAIDALRVRLA